jgi:hypothetical protein
MTSRKSSFGAILGVALVVGSQLTPPARAQGTQPSTAANVKESETERLSRRLNAEIDRRDGRVSSKRTPAEQAKYDRELAKENELLQKSGREAGERYRAEVRASQARSAEEKRARARALGVNPPPAKGM